MRYSAKQLKVRTGEVLSRVAEGDVAYITNRGKTVARIEPLDEPRTPAEIATLDALIDRLHGALEGVTPGPKEFLRQKRREERSRDRKAKRR